MADSRIDPIVIELKAVTTNANNITRFNNLLKTVGVTADSSIESFNKYFKASATAYSYFTKQIKNYGSAVQKAHNDASKAILNHKNKVLELEKAQQNVDKVKASIKKAQTKFDSSVVTKSGNIRADRQIVDGKIQVRTPKNAWMTSAKLTERNSEALKEYLKLQEKVTKAQATLEKKKSAFMSSTITTGKNVSVLGEKMLKETNQSGQNLAANLESATNKAWQEAQNRQNQSVLDMLAKKPLFGPEQVAKAFEQAKIEAGLKKAESKAWDEAFTQKLQKNDVPTIKGIVEQYKTIRQHQKEIGKESEKNHKRTKNIHRSIRDIAATLYTIRRIFTMMKQLWNKVNNLIEASASWTENLNLLEVVFDDVSAGAEKTKKWVDDISNSYLMDKNAITQYVSIFKQMANAMGQASDVGEKLSETLTLIGFDIASLRNVKTETAINDLASAIAGQVKPVRKYGFDITQQSIDTLLKESGIGGSSATLTQAEKQLARTILLVRQSQDAWGDLGKTINTFSNQQRIMNDQWTTFKRLIGNALVGIVEIGDSFEEAYAKAGPATRMIWNINGALIAMNSIVKAVVPEVENFGGSVAQESDLATDSLEELEDAANSSLAPFDKFNVMNSGSGMANGFTSTRKALEALLGTETDKYGAAISQRMEDIQTYSKDIADDILKRVIPAYGEWKAVGENASKTFADFYKETNQSLETLFPWIGPLKESWSNFKTIMGSFLKELPNLLSASLNLLSGILEILNPIVGMVAETVGFLSENGLLVGTLGTILAIVVSIKAVAAFATMVKNVKELLPLFKKLIERLGVAKTQTTELGLATKKLPPMWAQMTMLAGSFVAAGAGIAIYSQNFKQMSNTAKVLIPIVSTLLGIMVTLASVKLLGPIGGVAAGIATFGVAMAGISAAAAKFQFADGGYINGGIFNAGESGPEWVGRQGSTSTIINDRQMDEIMGDAVERGVMNALSRSNYGRNGNGKIAVVNMNGKALFEVVEEQGKKVGKVFAKA